MQNAIFQAFVGANTTLEKFENSALFLGFSPPSTLIRHENEAFRKRSSKRRNLETLTFRLDGKNWKTELFENDDITIIIYLSCDFPNQDKSKLSGCWSGGKSAKKKPTDSHM